jgi:HSP20 family molecular chaperone IbpA
MSLFPRFPAGEFASLFRLLDDCDVHRSSSGSGFSSVRSFAPKFDVREVKDAYHLDGELPGIDQKNISIEFTDPHTLVIKGHTEREYSSGPPQGHIEEAPENDNLDEATAAKTNTSETTVQKSSAGVPVTAQSQPKYWVSERSVGEFHRTFTFPTRVNQDAVKASLNSGILSIVVPKAKAPQSKKITIE